MRAKVIVAAAYLALVLLPATLLARGGAAQDQSAQTGQRLIKLDEYGTRGVVTFDHDKHRNRINPDPNAVFKAKASAACDGCHHTYDKFTGVIQLWKCTSCHRGIGDPKNPVGADYDSEWSKTAYHNLCIGCHLASKKGPVKCGDCHKDTMQMGRLSLPAVERSLSEVERTERSS